MTNEPPERLPARQRRVASAILIVGFTTALGVYVTTPATEVGQVERPEDSKRYLRQMETYGGASNVLASEFREWFSGLWQGRALAGTIAFLTVILAGLALVVLMPLPRKDATSRAEPNRGKADG